MRRRYIYAAALLVLLSLGGAFAILLQAQVSGCSSFLGRPVVKSELASRSFGAITTFSLPAPERWPNAIAVAPDGSVWFGEEAVWGLAHLYVTNGTGGILFSGQLPGKLN